MCWCLVVYVYFNIQRSIMSKHCTPYTNEEPDDPGEITPDSMGSTSSSSTQRPHPFLTPEDMARNTLTSIGQNGRSTSLEEFSMCHTPTHSSVKTRESLWAVSFPRHRREPSITQGFSWIYRELWYPLVRFELTILATKLDDSNLRIRSSFRAVCEDPVEDIVAIGDVSDFFHPDHGLEGRYYLVHRALTFTTIRRPDLLARRLRIESNKIGNASSRYDSYLRMSYFARRLRDVRRALNPTLALSALAASIAANPTFALELRSGLAITGTVISSLSCGLYAAGVGVEILEGRLIRLILDASAPPPSSGLIRTDILRIISSLKRCSAIFIALAAVAASIASHPDIPYSTSRGFALAGIVLAASGCVLYLVSGTTYLFAEDRISAVAEKDESAEWEWPSVLSDQAVNNLSSFVSNDPCKRV
ncbi:hypothetical protein BT69DRAFT_1352209 [Atractiella rhizophila]|nr:hypothetical protein BT69DRAFT_1352209 [Atractiella rhizophila]